MTEKYEDYEKLADSVGMPDGMDDRIIRSIKQEFCKNRKKRFHPAVRVAALLLIIASAAGVITGGASILNRIHLTRNNQLTLRDDTVYLGNYAVSYIPDGFYQKATYDEISVEFQSGNAHITILLLDDASNIGGITEFETIEIDGRDAVIRETEINGIEEIALIGNFVEHMIYIQGNISKDEIIKIFKNIVPLS